MKLREKGNAKLIQKLNRTMIFDTIRKHSPISRSDIARRNHLSPTTVATAVNELMEQKLVYEGDQGASSGGRKPILLHFSPDSQFIIGVVISPTVISIGCMNLESQVQYKRVFTVNGLTSDGFINYLLTLLDAFIEDIDNIRSCIGISIISPGIVDYESGIVRYSANMKLQDVQLKKLLEARYHMKAWLDNDSNAVALAEKEIGHYRNFDNIFYIIINDGVGAGIILNGTIFRGHHGGSAELGHTTVERGGIRCQCGNQGCLERYVSWTAIYSRIISDLARHSPSEISELIDNDWNRLTPAVFLQALHKGDDLAKQILKDVASYLSTAIINIINLFNPEVIVLDGGIVTGNQLFIDWIKQFVSEQSLQVNVEDLDIRTASLGQDAELVSAANLAIHDEFNIPFVP